MAAAVTDEQIHRMAEARVTFRRHLFAYVVLNLFFAALWAWTDAGGHYWPLWVHLGWGLGLAFSWHHAYGPGQDAVAREERRLREKLGR